MHTIQVGKKQTAPNYIRLAKRRLASSKFERICIEATSVDSNAKAMRISNSLSRWGYGNIVKLSMKKSNTLLMVHVERAPTFETSLEEFQEEKAKTLAEIRERKAKSKAPKEVSSDKENVEMTTTECGQ